MCGCGDGRGRALDGGLDTEKADIKVDQVMATNVPGIYAAGDITSYPGKLKLIATGVAEAVIAVNNAVHYINPKAKVNPGALVESGDFRADGGLSGYAIFGLRKNRSSPPPGSRRSSSIPITPLFGNAIRMLVVAAPSSTEASSSIHGECPTIATIAPGG
jgi:hypothetical protein